MFRTVPLSNIRSFSLYTQEWYTSYRFADSLLAGSGWNAVRQEFFTVHTAMVLCHTGLLTACEQEHMLSFHSKNKIEKLVHLVGFITRFLTLKTLNYIPSAICWHY